MRLNGVILDNRYKISHQLGEGGMAQVFQARDLKQDLDVAVKILPPGDYSKNDFILRFQREFKVCSELNHPNIVKMYSCGQTDDHSSWYYAMELFHCKDLEEVLEEKSTLSPKDCLRIAVPMVKAFRHYHKRGIVHRDLKPANIMVEKSGRIVIVDFGLVHDPCRTQLTKSGVMVGTPLYMSPELLSGTKPDCRSDIFQLGSIIHECLCGTPAFIGKNLQEVGSRILFGQYTSIREFNPDVSKDWETFLFNCLGVKPADRYTDADHVLADLKKLAKEQPLLRLVPPPKAFASLKPLSLPTAQPPPKRANTSKPSKAQTTHQMDEGKDLPVSEKGTFPQAISQKSKGASSGRTRMIRALTLIVMALIIGFYSMSLSDNRKVAPAIVKEFHVTGGYSSLLVSWSSTTKTDSPRFDLWEKTPDGTKSPAKDLFFSPVKIHTTADDSVPKYRHEVIVRGLKGNTSYEIVLNDGTSSKTLPRTVKTQSRQLSLAFTFNSDGNLNIHVRGQTPFSIEEIGSDLTFKGQTLRRNSEYYSEGSLQVPLKSIISNYGVIYTFTSIDGDVLECRDSALTIIGKLLDEVFASFMESRDVSCVDGKTYVPFFSEWNMKNDENWMFQKYALEYLKEIDEEKKRTLLVSFWETIEEKLTDDFEWYRKLTPLLPGLKKLIPHKELPWQFRNRMGLALIGLELIQGTSVSYRISDNEHWSPLVSPDSRPFTLSRKATIESIALEVTGFLTDDRLREELPVQICHDMAYPTNYDTLKNSILGAYIGEHDLEFQIDQPPDSFEKAEIALDFRSTGNPSMVVILSINNGRFIATIRPTRDYFVKFHESWHPDKNFDTILVRSYTENKLLSLGRIIEEHSSKDLDTTFRAFKATMISMDQSLPHVAGISLFHPIPTGALKHGRNTVKIAVVNGPSAVSKPLVYKSLRFLLGK